MKTFLCRVLYGLFIAVVAYMIMTVVDIKAAIVYVAFLAGVLIERANEEST
mgnify:CR=1 FL=1